ncbi:MAG: hypothetical protein ABFR89_12005 [Actinomycetota bacterium]
MVAPASSETNAGIPLSDPDDDATTLAAFAADPLVVVLVRYFGCLPCQEFVRDLDRERGRLPNKARVIAVGGSAAYQARWLRDTKGVEMPLLLDAEQRVRAIADLGDLTAREMSSAAGAGSYLRSILSGFRPQVPTTDATKAPGILMLDRDFSVAWVHRGHALGDYPPIDELIARAEALKGHG